MSSVGKLVVLILVLAVLGVVAHDAFEITKAQKDVRTTAQSVANAAAQSISTTRTDKTAKQAADSAAAHAGDVVTVYTYDPVADTVRVTVGASADTWVAGRIHRGWSEGIKGSATARPAVVGIAK